MNTFAFAAKSADSNTSSFDTVKQQLLVSVIDQVIVRPLQPETVVRSCNTLS